MTKKNKLTIKLFKSKKYNRLFIAKKNFKKFTLTKVAYKLSLKLISE